MKIQPLLDYINRYVELTPEEAAIIEEKVIFRKYLKGQFVLQQGDVCKYQSFVISGCTKTYYSDEEGQEHIVLFSVEDWWLSDIGSFMSQSPADFNIQCIEPTELIMFSYEATEYLYEKIPKLERFFRQVLERGLVATQKRLIRNFSLSAKEHYLYFKEQYPEIEQRIPQYLVASYLGITKEFLSKIKAQLLFEE
ncbi:Crp/Fnr family transcriptional regulator [Gaetbulibacter aestuarii]|uniref:Crp/Fnr family transcriptional regulator n=1 Tax=Gaetbulibacter aestuarii TaxID=1502358 RepID=A0ABW7MZ74_9FLAO